MKKRRNFAILKQEIVFFTICSKCLLFQKFQLLIILNPWIDPIPFQQFSQGSIREKKAIASASYEH